MDVFDFLDAFYNKKHSQDDLISDLDGILSSEMASVRLIPFGCEEESMDWLDGYSHSRRHVFLKKWDQRLNEYQLEYEYKQEGEYRRELGRFFIFLFHSCIF